MCYYLEMRQPFFRHLDTLPSESSEWINLNIYINIYLNMIILYNDVMANNKKKQCKYSYRVCHNMPWK